MVNSVGLKNNVLTGLRTIEVRSKEVSLKYKIIRRKKSKKKQIPNIPNTKKTQLNYYIIP